jgi:hypothetical protein
MRVPRLLLPTIFVLALSVTVLACEPAPRMHLERATVATGNDVVVTFDAPLTGRATNQYWIALQPADAAVNDTTGRVLLYHDEHGVRLRAVAPGDYEVRLHGSYPKDESHLLVRVPVKVEGLPVKAGSEQSPGVDACVDRWLAEQKLDAFGSPLGTGYAGGTPAFDETTGTARSRFDVLAAKFPGLARTCDGVRGASP